MVKRNNLSYLRLKEYRYIFFFIISTQYVMILLSETLLKNVEMRDEIVQIHGHRVLINIANTFWKTVLSPDYNFYTDNVFNFAPIHLK